MEQCLEAGGSWVMRGQTEMCEPAAVELAEERAWKQGYVWAMSDPHGAYNDSLVEEAEAMWRLCNAGHEELAALVDPDA